MKVATMPPRNSPQKVRLCQLPGSGVGQMRKGGARRVRSSSRSRMRPAVSPQAKTRSVMAEGTKQIPFAEMRQVVDGFATAAGPSRRHDILDLLIIGADLGLLGELGVDLGEDRPHVRFR